MYNFKSSFGSECRNCGAGDEVLHAVEVGRSRENYAGSNPILLTVLCHDCLMAFTSEHFQLLGWMSYCGIAFDPKEEKPKEDPLTRAAEKFVDLFDGRDDLEFKRLKVLGLLRSGWARSMKYAVPALDAAVAKRWPQESVTETATEKGQ